MATFLELLPPWLFLAGAILFAAGNLFSRYSVPALLFTIGSLLFALGNVIALIRAYAA